MSDGHVNGWCGDSKRHAIYLRDDEKCIYCGSYGPLSLDHLVCRSAHEGKIDHGAHNLVTCCGSCNSSRKAMVLEAWVATIATRTEQSADAIWARIGRHTVKKLDYKAGAARYKAVRAAQRARGDEAA